MTLSPGVNRLCFLRKISVILNSFLPIVATSFWSYSSAMLIFVVVFAFVSKPFRSVHAHTHIHTYTRARAFHLYSLLFDAIGSYIFTFLDIAIQFKSDNFVLSNDSHKQFFGRKKIIFNKAIYLQRVILFVQFEVCAR